jgi:hypothetical protein
MNCPVHRAPNVDLATIAEKKLDRLAGCSLLGTGHFHGHTNELTHFNRKPGTIVGNLFDSLWVRTCARFAPQSRYGDWRAALLCQDVAQNDRLPVLNLGPGTCLWRNEKMAKGFFSFLVRFPIC